MPSHTYVYSWTFVSLCARASEPCFFEHARKSDPSRGHAVTQYLHKMTNNKCIPTPDVISVKYNIICHSCLLCFIDFSICACNFLIDGEFYCYKVTSGNLPLPRHNYQKIQHNWVDLSFTWRWCSINECSYIFMCIYRIRSNSTTPQRVALARMFKEAGLRSPRTQLTKVQIGISVQGRHTEANLKQI